MSAVDDVLIWHQPLVGVVDHFLFLCTHMFFFLFIHFFYLPVLNIGVF